MFHYTSLLLLYLEKAATKILARQLVRLRQQITNLQGSHAQIRGVATHTQALYANTSISTGMKGATKAMVAMNELDFWTETENAIKRAYHVTYKTILDKAVDLGTGDSTAVTAILINCQKQVVANVWDSHAVICKNGVAKQLSVDHEPDKERSCIEDRGGFVSKFPGDVPHVDGQLEVARAFGDKGYDDFC
ncbi:hypothetical protein AgCh_028208 [Apium graveolens]